MTKQNNVHPLLDPAQNPCDEISDPARLCQTPLVSVAMITYNHARYIGEAIEGVVSQKADFPFELIIGEDCSTDATRAIVLDYQKRYPHIIRVLISAKNVGAAANGARTLRACRGDYVAFCEGDDAWVMPEKLQRQVGFLQQNREYVLAYSGGRFQNEELGLKGLITPKPYDTKDVACEDLPVRLLRADIYIPTASAVFRREALLHAQKNDPDALFGMFDIGDLPLFLEVSRYGKFKYFAEPMMHYNVLAESASHSKNPVRLLSHYASVIECQRYYMRKFGISERDQADSLERLADYDLRVAYDLRYKPLAIQSYRVLQECRRTTVRYFMLYYGTIHPWFHWLVAAPLHAIHLGFCLLKLKWVRRVQRRHTAL
jgi:glycosyltransferase involved in cell wall biosynthesis